MRDTCAMQWFVLRLPVLAALVTAISLAGTAFAGPFTDALAAYKVGDYAGALALFQPLADEGNRTAEFYLGLMHAYGQGGPQDITGAIKWYRRAADQGHGGAQYMLGVR